MKNEIKLEDAILKVVTELKTDSDYCYSWQANIAMAYQDAEYWYRLKTGKKYLNRQDKHIIANKAAKSFLINLCGGGALPFKQRP